MLDLPSDHRGFTLLELMVVLGLISLLSAVAFPGLLRLYESVARSAEEENIVAAINELGLRAWESGQAISLDDRTLKLPEGWRIETPEPVLFRSNGVCLGGSVRLVQDGVLRKSFELEAPYCQVSLEI